MSQIIPYLNKEFLTESTGNQVSVMSQIIPYLNEYRTADSYQYKSFSNVSNYTLLKLGPLTP